MSQSGVYFHHEAVNGCNSINDYMNKVQGCGDSTTCFDIAGCHDKKVIIVKSDDEVERCIEWCDKTYLSDSREFITHLNSRLKLESGLRINQSEINERLPDIWRYLLGYGLDARHMKMIDFNIQVQNTSIDEQAAKIFYESIRQDTQQIRH